MAHDAGADAFITGALLKVGPTQLRLDVRAQDTNTGQIVFSDKLEGQDVQSIFGMVDRLTANIAASFLPAAEVPQQAPEIEQATDVERGGIPALPVGRRSREPVPYHRSDPGVERGGATGPAVCLAMMQLVQQYALSGDFKSAQT